MMRKKIISPKKGAAVGGGSPRVKICVSWWKIAVCLSVFFIANVSLLLFTLERHSVSDEEDDELSSMDHLRRSKERSKKRKDTIVSLAADTAGEQAGESSVSLASYSATLKGLEDSFGKRSCRRNAQGEYSFNGDSCPHQENTPITYYNPLPFKRLVCGAEVPPEKSIQLLTKCKTPSRLFPVNPDRTGRSMPQVRLAFQNRFGGEGREFPCDIPCLNFGSPSVNTIRNVATIDGGSDWSLFFSMEGPQYYNMLYIDPAAYKSNHFYSTTSYKSEVPLPYFSWAEYNIVTTKAVDFDNAIKGASFLARNCASRNNRENLVKELQESTFRIDSMSACLRNAQPPPGVDLSDKNQVMRSYLFYLAFENQCEEDYITEKLWGPLESGTVPIYYGAPNVKDHVPNRSIIHVDDFASTAKLAEYLNKVANDRTLYEQHQAWRAQPLPPHFHAKYDFTEVHSTCRTCRWAYARFYGLGWNHNNQSLRELATPREPCLDLATGLLNAPISEQYLSDGPVISISNPVGAACPLEENSASIEVGPYFRRTVAYQDGAIDLWIEAQSSVPVKPIRLRFEVPRWNRTEAMQFKVVTTGHVRIQGKQTRYTFLTWPNLPVDLKKNSEVGGIVEITLVPSSLPLRVRILVEDLDTLHQGADQEENFFGSLMIRDFFHPVESFI